MWNFLHPGVTAVPVYPPNPNALSNDLPKMKKIVEDAEATLVLTTGSYLSAVRISSMRFLRWPGKVWQATDSIKATPKLLSRAFAPPSCQVAFLQYTSGSTGDPKGVMVGSTNIAHNIMFVRRTLRLQASSKFLSWLPQYHDLGLIVAYLTTLSAGASGFYLSPVAFIKRPALWVQLMSKFKITHTAAPNFALDLCSRKFNPAQDAGQGFDLSSLESLLNAAEPVRVESIKKWNETFAPYGWHPSAMCPCYGLAEHVVGVVGWGSKILEVGSGSQRSVLHSSGNTKTFPIDGRVLTVNPESCTPCGEGEEGEIWARSQHVTLGYWKKPELSKEVFQGRLTAGAPGADEGVYLRTGDLGFILDDQLFVTGRIKDLIIIRGKNFYPQDIEKTVEEASEHVRAGCVATFSVQALGGSISAAEEAVAVVAEVKTLGLGAEELGRATRSIRSTVVRAHGVMPATVALIPPRTIPKTTSGKIRRKETCTKLTQGALKILNKKFCATDMSAHEVPQVDEEIEEHGEVSGSEALAEKDVAGDVSESIAETDKTAQSQKVIPDNLSPELQEEPEPMVNSQVALAPSNPPADVHPPRKDEVAAASQVAPATSAKISEHCPDLRSDVPPPEAKKNGPAGPVAPFQPSEISASRPTPSKVYISPEIPDARKSLEENAGFGEGEKEVLDFKAKWEGKSIEEAILTMLSIQDQEVAPDESLISLGLTSLVGMDLIDLLADRTGVSVEPEQLELLTIGDLRALDNGANISTILNELEAPQRVMEGGECDSSTSLVMDSVPSVAAA